MLTGWLAGNFPFFFHLASHKVKFRHFTEHKDAHDIWWWVFAWYTLKAPSHQAGGQSVSGRWWASVAPVFVLCPSLWLLVGPWRRRQSPSVRDNTPIGRYPTEMQSEWLMFCLCMTGLSSFNMWSWTGKFLKSEVSFTSSSWHRFREVPGACRCGIHDFTQVWLLIFLLCLFLSSSITKRPRTYTAMIIYNNLSDIFLIRSIFI